MTTVRFDASLRYAVWIVAYLAGVTILGAGAVGLGLGLGWPSILGWSWLAATLGSTSGGLAYTLGGGLLIVLGVLVVAIGYVSGTYKLVADAVGTGTAELERSIAALEVQDVSVESTPAASAPPPEPTADDSHGAHHDTAADDADAVTAQPDSTPEPGDWETPTPAETAADPSESPPPETTAEASGAPDEPDEAPPEPSPEEIAFGSSEPVDEPAAELEDDDEPITEESGADDVSPAARSAPSDPLADPTDE